MKAGEMNPGIVANQFQMLKQILYLSFMVHENNYTSFCKRLLVSWAPILLFCREATLRIQMYL
jgi:hypothetical protein